jgi:hypothetical protein
MKAAALFRWAVPLACSASANGVPCRPCGGGRAHERVVARVKLDLVDAVTEAAVALELRREHIGQPRMGLHVGAASQGTQRLQWRGGHGWCVEPQRILHGPVALEQVDVHQRFGLVEYVMGRHAPQCQPPGAG